LIRAAKVIGMAEPPSEPALPFGRIADAVVTQFGAEARLSGTRLAAAVDDAAYSMRVETESMSVGLVGGLVAFMPLVQQTAATLAARCLREGLTIELIASEGAIDPTLTRRFFDASWPARPGGWLAMLGAQVIRVAAERWGGA